MAAPSDGKEIFSNLSSKLSQSLQIRYRGDQPLIEKALDELNSLNYRYPIVKNVTQAVLLIDQCCSFVLPDNPSVVSKCCQLMTSLISRQNVTVEGTTLTTAVEWCLECLRVTTEKSALVDILICLNALLRCGAKNIEPLILVVLKNDGPLWELLKTDNPPEVIVFALQCLEACSVPQPSFYKSQKPEKLEQLFSDAICVFKNYLSESNKSIDDVIYSKILMLCLRGLSNILTQHNFLTNDLGIYLGLVKSYMVYGLPDIKFLPPTKVMPSTLSIPEPAANPLREKKGGKVTKHRKQKNKRDSSNSKSKGWIDDDIATCSYVPATQLFNNAAESVRESNSLLKIKTSDSDFSDSESGRAAKLSVNQCRVRQASLNLFSDIIKLTDKGTMFSYWSCFIPENSLPGKHDLLTSILKDPSPKGRIAALNALNLLLSSSKFYLAQAESSDKNMSFTPFSAILGMMIAELHKSLLSALIKEKSIPVLVHILKCLAILVQSTPYSRLSPGIISETVKRTRRFLYHKDPSVQVVTLVVMGCILASEPVVRETKEVLTQCNDVPPIAPTDEKKDCQGDVGESRHMPPDDFDFVEFSSEEEDEPPPKVGDGPIPWLLQRCLFNLGVDFSANSKMEAMVSAPVRIESLQVLAAMSRNYFESLIVPHLQRFSRALEISLTDKNFDVKLHAGRAVDCIGQAMNQCFNDEATGTALTLDQGLAFWQTLLIGPITDLLQEEENAVLKAVGCDCVGSVGARVFDLLPRHKQLLLVTQLFSCTRDTENSVKAASVRALGIYVLYPTLREDTGFIMDVSAMVHRMLQDTNLLVRIRAAWALSNLSDTLVMNTSTPRVDYEYPLSMLLVLMNNCISRCNDNGKVRMSTVRALGNFLSILKISYLVNHELKDKFIEAVSKSMAVLIVSATNGADMKVRWNACYALGNALKNFAVYYVITWQETVFASLMDLVVNCRNFKVRINAALALSCPATRKMYGERYHRVWEALLDGLESSQNMEDFTEYKHKDHLVEQLCLSLAYLATLLTKDDLIPLEEKISTHLDCFKTHMKRAYERVLPEKSTVLDNAALHIKNFPEQEGLSNQQKETLNVLISIFVQDV